MRIVIVVGAVDNVDKGRIALYLGQEAALTLDVGLVPVNGISCRCGENRQSLSTDLFTAKAGLASHLHLGHCSADDLYVGA